MTRYTLTDSDTYGSLPLVMLSHGDEFDMGIYSGTVLTVNSVTHDVGERLYTVVCDGADGATYERSFDDTFSRIVPVPDGMILTASGWDYPRYPFAHDTTRNADDSYATDDDGPSAFLTDETLDEMAVEANRILSRPAHMKWDDITDAATATAWIRSRGYTGRYGYRYLCAFIGGFLSGDSVTARDAHIAGFLMEAASTLPIEEMS